MIDLNLYGPINDFGYGNFTKGIITGLVSIGRLNFYLCPIGGITLEDANEKQIFESYATRNMWDRKAPAVAVWHEFDLNKFSADKLIAYPIFETTKFNEQGLNYLKQMDGICVPSQWAKDVVMDNIGDSVPTYVVPGASDDVFLTLPNGQLPNGQVQKSSAFTFFSMGKFEARKSSLETIISYVDAFESVEADTRLIMHCFNPFDQQFEARLVGLLTQRLGLRIIPSTRTSSIVAARGHAIVEIPKTRLSKQDIQYLIRTCHAGIFPSRAEGWNLPLMETIKAGLPCIATDYSAHTEYLTEEYNYPKKLLLTNLSKATANDGIFFKGDRGDWMTPNKEEMIEKMSYVYNNYDKIIENFNTDKIQETFTWANTAQKLMQAVDEVNS
jgi:glycosyltransferase involved in cell wall biosynthesis